MPKKGIMRQPKRPLPQPRDYDEREAIAFSEMFMQLVAKLGYRPSLVERIQAELLPFLDDPDDGKAYKAVCDALDKIREAQH
jgi:hypothetical protein